MRTPQFNSPYYKTEEEMIGERNDRLVVASYFGTDKNGKRLWVCKCDCGNEVIRKTEYLHRKGRKKSCGCYKVTNKTIHNMSRTRINRIYRKMKSRCYNKNNYRYKNYGGRGITVCDEWLGKNGFSKFAKWSFENGYSDVLTIDRINNDGNYEPSNCRWVDNYVQANNKSTNRLLSYKGKVQNVKQWSEETGLPYGVIYSRINKLGWSVEKALETEVANCGRKSIKQ